MAAAVVFKILELVGGGVIGLVLDRSAPDGKIYNFLNWFKARIANGEELLWKLKTDLTVVSKVLDDAENKEITDRFVKLWLDELKDVAYEAEDLLAYESHAIASDSSSAVAEVGTEVEEKLKKILERLSHLKKERKILGLQDCGRKADVSGHNLPRERRTTSLVDDSEVEGRGADTEAITKLLQHDGAFPSLEELRLSECPKLESALPVELPSLKKLKIKGCDQLVNPFPRARAIVDVRVKDKSRDVNLDLESSPPSLSLSGINSLSLDQLLGDIRQTLGERIVDLKRLRISNCDMASGYQGTDSCSQLGGVLEHFKWLNTLEIHACSEVVFFPNYLLASPTLTRLELVGLEKLKSLPEQMKSGLPCLVDLVLWDCPELESFPEGGLPSKLESLTISGCKKLMERRKEWNLQALPALSSLRIQWYSFDETESFPEEGLLPPTLTTLRIEYLDGLKSLDYKGLQHLTSLKTLEIYCCYSLEKLVTDEEGREGLLPQSLTTLELRDIHRLTSLRSLCISGCNNISDEVTLPSTITFLKLEYMNEITRRVGSSTPYFP